MIARIERGAAFVKNQIFTAKEPIQIPIHAGHRSKSAAANPTPDGETYTAVTLPGLMANKSPTCLSRRRRSLPKASLQRPRVVRV